MMKKRNPGLIVAMSFMTIIFFIQGLYMYFGEHLPLSQILSELGIDIVNVVLVFGFALVVTFTFLILYKRLFKK